MKFIVDAQLPPGLAQWLRDRGHEAEHVAEIGLMDASDLAIRDVAIERSAILVTKDRDFVPWAIAPPAALQIVWVRVGNTGNATLTATLDAAWDEILASLRAGARVVELSRG